MKNRLHILEVILACLLAVSMVGCSEDIEEEPVTLLCTSVPEDSSIQPDATLTFTFDGAPINLIVSHGDVKTAGNTAKVSGPFPPGPLKLELVWENGNRTLNYTVEGLAGKLVGPGGVVSVEMVLIPAGEFEMGSVGAGAGVDERPVHTVYLDAFYMDEYEVTNAQYREFVLANPEWQKQQSRDSSYLRDWDGNDYPSGKGNHPVYMGWYSAMAYAQWAGKRLPTEAEWEKAARGGLVGKRYPWGDSRDPTKGNFSGAGTRGTTPVGTYPANGYGLYDMAGNVSEWCLDEYRGGFYHRSARRNPIAGAESITELLDSFTEDNQSVRSKRVLRGGPWGHVSGSVRVAARESSSPSKSAFYPFGFRCVKSATP